MHEVILGIITILLNFYLGLSVFLRNPLSWTNRLFLALTLFINGYVFTNYISLHPFLNTPENQLLWIRIVMAEASFLGPTLLLLVHTFPRADIQLGRIKLVLLSILALTSFFLCLSPFVFPSIQYPNGQPVPQPGPAIPVFILDFAGLFLLSFVVLIVKYRKATGLEKIQLRYFLLGIILTFTLMMLSTVFLVVIFKFSGFVFLGPLYTLILVVCIAYAIVKHRLLDIRLIIARTVAFTFLLLSLFSLYTLIVFGISATFLNLNVSNYQALIFALIAIFVAITSNPLKQVFESTTDKMFFKGGYNSTQLLSELGHIMSSNIELQILTREILTILISKIKITRGAFVLIEKESVYETIFEGFTNQSPKYSYTDLKPFLLSTSAIVFDELSEDVLKKTMRALDISVASILKVKNQPIGVLFLGEKASGEIYSEQDIYLLDILAPEVAIAIQNAKSYEEIKKFNITLQEEIEQATKELKGANLRLKTLDKLKDDFVSIASHELRTPMTAIRSYAWMALNRSDVSLSEKMKKYLSRTLISTERLISLVNDMLNISRIESGRIEVSPQEFDVQSLVDDVFTEVEVRAKEKRLHLQVQHSTLPKIFADQDKVLQVLLNLIGNALKFTPQGGDIIVTFFSDGKVVETSIKDTGVGILADDIERLFKKFSRLDNSYVAAAASGGTGLGLFISKSLIELMKGKIWVNSEGQGKGATFTFSLPVATPEILSQAEKFRIKVKGEAKLLEPVAII